MTAAAGRRTLAATLTVGILLAGAMNVTYTPSTADFDVVTVEVPFGKLVAGSSVGDNATNASASFTGSALGSTTQVFYLNNTNATGAYHVKLASTGVTGLVGVTTLRVGIDNGTSSVDQIKVGLESLTQSSGSFVRLEPGSTNRIYATHTVDLLLHGSTAVAFVAHLSDDEAGSAFSLTRGEIRLT